MGLNTMGLTIFDKKWFDGTPKNAKKATATLTFTDAVVAAETVTIGNDVYEFVAEAGDIAKETNVAVVVGADLTADNAVEKLETAINANSGVVTSVANTEDNTCVISYIAVGTDGNDISVSTNCTGASFEEGATKLGGGQYATPCNTSKALVAIGNDVYFTVKPVNKWTEDGWYKAENPALL